ncbi:Myosin 10A, isoform D [Dinochytrium kinnereticum]|nr:Myosin 10A, isoform D [Dinochytrium kinnereticum]
MSLQVGSSQANADFRLSINTTNVSNSAPHHSTAAARVVAAVNSALAPMRYAKAMYDFPAKETDELQLEEEDVIAISSTESKGGWLYGENNGAWGWFPERYVRFLSEEEAISEGLTPAASPASPSTPLSQAAPSSTAVSISPVPSNSVSETNAIDDDLDEAEDNGAATPSSVSQKSSVGWFSKKRQKKSKPVLPVKSPGSDALDDKPMSRTQSIASEVGSVSTAAGESHFSNEPRSRMNSAGVPPSVSFGSEKNPKVAPKSLSKNNKNIAELVKSGKGVAIVGAPAEIRQTWLEHLGGQEAADRLGISKQERKRQEIIYEILCTEKDYVNDLETVIEVYMKQFRKNKLLRPKDMSVIFSNIDSILPINMELLKLLEDRQAESENNVVEQVGDIFIRVSDYLKMYTMYCSNHPYAVMKLQALRNAKAFAKFLDQCAAMPESRNLGLQHFLLKPIQRICKYPLFLRELIKNTEACHSDYPDLVKALLKIETVVTIVNEGARQAEGIHKMLELQNRFTQKVNIVAPSRTMKKNGTLELIANGERKKRELFLFNDMLLVAKSQSSDGEKLKVVAMVPFDMILVNSPPDEAGNENLIEIVHINTAKFTLAAENNTARLAWMRTFKEATDAWMAMKNRGTGIEIEERSIRTAAMTATAERRSEEPASICAEVEPVPLAIAEATASLSSVATLALETETDRTINDLKSTTITVTAPTEQVQGSLVSHEKTGPPPLPLHGVPLSQQMLNASSPTISPSTSIRKELGDRAVSSTPNLDRISAPNSPSIKNRSRPDPPSPRSPLSGSADFSIEKDTTIDTEGFKSTNNPPLRSHSMRIGGSSQLAARIASNHFIVQDLTVRATHNRSTTTTSDSQADANETNSEASLATHARSSSFQPRSTAPPSSQSRTTQLYPQILPRYPTTGLPATRSATSCGSDVSKRLVISATVRERQERLEMQLAQQSAPVSCATTPRASIQQPIAQPVPQQQTVAMPHGSRPRTQSLTDRALRSVSGDQLNLPAQVIAQTNITSQAPTRSAPPLPPKPIDVSLSLLSLSVEEEGKPGDDLTGGETQAKKISVNKPVKKAIITDVTKKSGKQSKDFVYSIRVQYVGIGDNNSAVIHHTFEDFFDFHLQLLGHFPEEAGLQIRRFSSEGESESPLSSNRIIPELPCQMMFVSEAVAKTRIGQLQEYIQAITTLPPKISRSPITMQFFRLDGKHAQALSI